MNKFSSIFSFNNLKIRTVVKKRVLLAVLLVISLIVVISTNFITDLSLRSFAANNIRKLVDAPLGTETPVTSLLDPCPPDVIDANTMTFRLASSIPGSTYKGGLTVDTLPPPLPTPGTGTNVPSVATYSYFTLGRHYMFYASAVSPSGVIGNQVYCRFIYLPGAPNTTIISTPPNPSTPGDATFTFSGVSARESKLGIG